MNVKIKRFTFYNIFFLCAFFSLFIFLKFDSFASNTIDLEFTYRENFSNGIRLEYILNKDSEYRYCVYFSSPFESAWADSDNPLTYTSNVYLFTNAPSNTNVSTILYKQPIYSGSRPYNHFNNNGSLVTQNTNFRVTYNSDYALNYVQLGYYSTCKPIYIGDAIQNDNVVGCPMFTSMDDVRNYISSGILPQLPYDDSLELDSFKVTSWTFGNFQLIFSSKFVVEWSDSRISTVQVVLSSTNGRISFESSLSPFKQKFEPENYVLKKGDVVHLVATPYMSDGTYGVSLYQSFVYSDDVPGSNVYRKFTNTPYSDNTLTIPYTGVSDQPQSVTLPVDGITTNTTYKVNYNPVTNEYGDLNVYEVYYSPVLVYPSDTPTSEVDETQDVINNTYTTNNYYETTKNINIGFDVNFDDISGSDIQNGYDDFGNFSNGFGGFISKLSSWVLALFPFLSPVVASAIVFMFGLVILIAIIALVLKIVSVIADLIPL